MPIIGTPATVCPYPETKLPFTDVFSMLLPIIGFMGAAGYGVAAKETPPAFALGYGVMGCGTIVL